ncbi:hypothetical protein [Chryseobacterium viscerum]|uniref:Uncharacterized protein n=1 Tax=Chryseobacterium viscerum TaxID=1037377 RepID=A0A5N4BT35_9FLAO|nr:hypothetical protein [Chryseobacterium viscerum]KAB1231624.1 hypothetical protein F8D52_07410 [Chryseobacterium viscerum]
MKSLQQQLKSILPFYKGVWMLLFVFLMIPTLNAQSFYYKEGTQITVLENATLYITDSGVVHQNRLRNFEGNAVAKKQVLNGVKGISFNSKKNKFLSKKIKKEAIIKPSKENIQIERKVVISQFVTSIPDNFFSTYQKGNAISASVTVHSYLKYSIENKILNLSQEYLHTDDDKIINNSFIFFKDYYLFQYKTRPPPFECI